MNTFKRLFLPISISAIAYGVLFGIVDILLTGGFAQGLESQGVGVLLIAFPMAGALFSIVALSCLTILGTLSRLLKPENRWKHLAEFVVGALSMLPAWFATYVFMGLENGFGFTHFHITIAFVTALLMGTIAVVIATNIEKRTITMW